ncbi:MAG: hypothetical protein U1E65_29890 [Myxococcota bacterium]
MKRLYPLAWACALGLGACSSDRVTVHATIDLPTAEKLNPMPNLVRMRAELDGSENADDVAHELDLSAREVSFPDYPGSRTYKLTLKGYDESDNLVAYGEVRGELKTSSVDVKLPFRRLLGYVTHRAPCDAGCGNDQVCASPLKGPFECVPKGADCDACGAGTACVQLTATATACASAWGTRVSKAPGVVYVVDVGTRSRLDTLTLPGNHPRGLGVFARGGDGVWIVYKDDAATKATFLSSSDHTFGPSIDLPFAHEIVVASPSQRYAVAAGGGAISFIDQENNTILRSVQVGGSVYDVALGGENQRDALFVTSAGLLEVPLDLAETTEGANPGDISRPAGVAVDDNGRIAYVSSGASGAVLEIDLFVGTAIRSDDPNHPGGPVLYFPGPAGAMTLAGGLLVAMEGGAKPQHVVSFQVNGAGATAGNIGVLPNPSDIVAAPGGSGILLVSAGTSSASAGLTIIDATVPPTASTVTYFRDPTDMYRDPSGPMFPERYQPRRLGILYGQ